MKKKSFAATPYLLLALPLLVTACVSAPKNEQSAVHTGPVAALGQKNTQAWFCDNLQIATQFGDEKVTLYVRDRTLELNQVRTASGSKYEAGTKPETWFWQKGNEASFMLDGQEMPHCYVAGHIPMPLTAQGNEPGWQVRLNGNNLMFTHMNASPERDLAYTTTTVSNLRTDYLAQGSQGPLKLTVTQSMCSDTMTGMPYPYSAQIKYNGEDLKGCAGSPQQVLRGSEWYVQEVAGHKVKTELARFTFLPEGRVVGYSGCNNFFGQYELTGEGIKFGAMGMTRRACPQEEMGLEQAVMSVFHHAYSVQVDAVGALIIKAGNEVGENSYLRAVAL